MSGQAFELAPALYGSIHELRTTHRGIQFLEQTGQFRDYMRTRITYGKPFIFWDGEGWTDNDGEHRYMLFGCSTGEHIEWPLLDSVSCLELMLRVAAQNPKVIHAIYGGGYDVTHILRDMPRDLRQRVYDGETVRWDVEAGEHTRRNNFTIEYLPHKWFIVSGFDWGSRKTVRFKLYDIMTFFQSSFITALTSRGIPVPDEITAGKASRAEFTFADLDEIKQYWQLELEKGVELANTLRAEFDEAGIKVTQFHGPGAVASAVFKQYGIRKHMYFPDPEIETAAQLAYFGGRFEQFKAGHYDGRVYVYDINSAYPHAIRNLPSLAGAKWEWSDKFIPGSFSMWRVSYDAVPEYRKPHPAAWRGNGGIVGFPAYVSETWLWEPEARHVAALGSVEGGWVLATDTGRKPFSFVEGMYRKRQEWKREGRGGEHALKLALNSQYGKQAQRVGGSEKYRGRPPWHQLEWAGYVTSTARGMLWEAISQKPDAVIAVETDSVTTTEPLDLDCGNGLGQWELTEYDWITYIQSGVYFTSGDGSGMKAKSRGIDVRELDHAKVMEYLSGSMDDPLLVRSRNFIALGNPQTALYGQWIDSVKEVSIGNGKRIHVPQFCSACDNASSFADEMHSLIANPNYGCQPSIPHSLPWREGEFTPIEELPVAIAVEEWQ